MMGMADDIDDDWIKTFTASLERIKPYLGHPEYKIISCSKTECEIYEAMGFVVHSGSVVFPNDRIEELWKRLNQ